MGGLSKKAFQIDKLQSEYGLPSLKVDGGNLLFKPATSSSRLMDQEKITALGIAKAYTLIGYDGVAVGALDLSAGVDYLEEVQKETALPFLSANLFCKQKKRPLIPQYRIVKKGALSIGIIGLTSNDASVLKAIKNEATVLPWRDVLPGIVKKLTGESDMIVVLSNYSLAANQAIAREFNEINLIVQSVSSPVSREPVQEKNALICQTGKQGKFLGWLQVDWQKSRKWGKEIGYIILKEKKRELDGTNARLNRYRKRLPKEELEAHEGYTRLLTSRKMVTLEIERMEESLLEREQAGQILSSFTNSFIAMDKTLPDEPEVLAVVEQIKQDIFEAGRKKSVAVGGKKPPVQKDLPSEPLEPYVGWKVCAECHEAQTAFWQNTDHAQSFKTLEVESQQYNMNCLPCHVTPEKVFLGEVPDQILLALPADLKTVGCETCHGPGLIHSNNTLPVSITRTPRESVCLRCHTPDQDDDFNYTRDIGLIGCPPNG